MIKEFLKKLAKKHLDLEEVQRGTVQITIPNQTLPSVIEPPKGAMMLVEQENRSLKTQIKAAQSQIKRMEEKYPSIWLKGDSAMGCVQLPHLKIAVEFFREENKFCVFVPWDDAAGKRPQAFVPPWLEVDENLPIESVVQQGMGQGKTGGVIFKIPVLGWDDTITLERRVEDDQPSYELDGKIREKTRSFRCQKGINGIFRRYVYNEKVSVILYFWEHEMPKPGLVNETSIKDYMPRGNLVYDQTRGTEWTFTSFGESPARVWQFRIPVTEIDLPKLGWKNKMGCLPPGTLTNS